MRVLVAVLHYGLLRNFESVIEQLARDGHDVILAAEEEDSLGGDRLAMRLHQATARVTLATIPSVGDDTAIDLGQRARLTLDYLRFRGEAPSRSAKLSQRLEPRLPGLFRRLTRRVGPVRMSRFLGRLEASLPVSSVIAHWLAEQRPDVLLLGSLTHYRSLAPDLHRAAVSLNVPVAACIYSWDHLSSKAQLRRVPEAVLVWNQLQAEEARRLHHIPADVIVVTGAQCYDQWFDRAPTRDGAAFRRAMGLDPRRPFLLYVCSALTPNPNEPAFVRDWIAAIRGSRHPVLRDIGIVIRPHPERAHEWSGVDLASWPNVVLRGAAPVDAQSKADYFDAIVHSEGVVGLVTSAFLDAAVAGRPVFTVTLPSYAVHQTEMTHFRYLLEVGDGLPAVARSHAEHVAQLAEVIDGDHRWQERQQRFLEAFIRPEGLSVPATPRFVSAVTATAHDPARRGQSIVPPLPSVVTRAAMALAGLSPVQERLRDDVEVRHQQGLAAKAGVKRRKRGERRRRRVTQLLRRLATGSQPPASSR